MDKTEKMKVKDRIPKWIRKRLKQMEKYKYRQVRGNHHLGLERGQTYQPVMKRTKFPKQEGSAKYDFVLP